MKYKIINNSDACGNIKLFSYQLAIIIIDQRAKLQRNVGTSQNYNGVDGSVCITTRVAILYTQLVLLYSYM